MYPPAFLQRMQGLLKDEYPAFAESLRKPAVNGLRANPLKIEPNSLLRLLPYSLAPVAWCPAGFVLSLPASDNPEFSPGKHPYHAAGLYYLQEPSAMAVAEILDPQPGERILDLAAAPGGKSTHIVSLMKNQGILVANEIHPQRVWELAENLERWGARNAIIINEKPDRLAARMEGFFDRVLIDAPCSGEGMFRKSEHARLEWSPALAQSCSVRQSAILEDAARLVRSGGVLVYSTCTFDPQENEAVIERFLSAHPEYELEEIPLQPGYSPGEPGWIDQDAPARSTLQRSVRLWPHRAAGEGHFVARLRHTGGYTSETSGMRQSNRIPRDVLECYQEFCLSLDKPAVEADRLMLRGTYLYQLPAQLPDWSGLRIIHTGMWLGTIKRGHQNPRPRFEPSHALALSLTPDAVYDAISLDLQQAITYLKGETMQNSGSDGWVLICVHDYPLGWGKRVKGQVKNYYPKGLRWK